MAVIRITLLTYRRPALLQRALSSLLAQTFADWRCELHNDAPDDDSPGRIIAGLADPRITLHQHEKNWGPVKVFNYAFAGAPEPFATLLEDDNWWQPNFLEVMIGTAERFPDVNVFWSNMRIWQEHRDGTFSDTGRLTHQVSPDEKPRFVHWGAPEQALAAIHSNGSLIYRTRRTLDPTPETTPFAIIEAFRDRVFDYPLVFIPEPLVNFASTLSTARPRSHSQWTEAQVMAIASFIGNARYNRDQLETIWTSAARQTPPMTNVLLLGALVEPACRPFWVISDRIAKQRLLRSLLRRPSVLMTVLVSRLRHSDCWIFLQTHTRKLFDQAGHRSL